jgi:hypothetical protein
MQNESENEYYERLLAEEELILDFSEEVCGRLNELGRDKSWLQKKLEIPQHFLTGADVPDLRRVADIALILGCEVVIKLEPIKEASK